MSQDEDMEKFFSKYDIKEHENGLRKFLTYEYYFLTNNASLNPRKFREDSKISKSTLDNYYNFPIIFTRSIFNALDKHNSGFVLLNEYVEGLLSLFTGTLKDRLTFVFNFFNVNKDQQINKKDISLILRYTHIFLNKKNIDLLVSIIDNFFGENSYITRENFIHHMTNVNSDIFFIFLCIVFEYQNFDVTILKEIQQENGLRCTDNGHKKKDESVYETLYEIKEPSQLVIDYILTNFNTNLEFLRKGTKKNTKDKNLISNISTAVLSDFRTEEEEEIQMLENFEKDLKSTLNSYIIQPSEDHEHKDGDEYLNLKRENILSPFQSPVCAGRTFSASSFSPSELIRRDIDSRRSNEKLNRHLSTFQEGNGLDCLSFLDAENSFFIGGNQREVRYAEEILMINKKNLQKKRILLLLGGYLFVYSKKVKNVLSTEGPRFYFHLKWLISLKHLYILKLEKGYLLNKKAFTKLILVSTVKYQEERFTLLFENEDNACAFSKLLVERTNYVSVQSEFTYIKEIGKGAFSHTKLMKHDKTHKYFTIKKVKKKFDMVSDYTSLVWEKDIVKFLSNYQSQSSIIKYYQILESAEYVYFIMDYIPTGSLKTFFNKAEDSLSPTIILEIVSQMYKGITFLHSFGIMHRDLKLENILIDYQDKDNFQIKIIDFGLSQVLTPFAKANEVSGTLMYCSPEILFNGFYDNRIDVWSAGVMIYYLEYKQMPFDIRGMETEKQLINIIINRKLSIPSSEEEEKKEEEAHNILNKIINSSLCKDINKRPTSEEVYSFLMKNTPKLS